MVGPLDAPWVLAEDFPLGCHDDPFQAGRRDAPGMAAGREAEPTAAIIDSPTLQITPKSGSRARDNEAKRKRGSKLHIAVDTLGHLLVLHGTPASAASARCENELTRTTPPVI